MTVAAEMTEMSTPFSGAPKSDSPTVSGRVDGELVTISGQRKLFLCVATEKSGTGQSSPASLSRLATNPAVWRNGSSNRILIDK